MRSRSSNSKSGYETYTFYATKPIYMTIAKIVIERICPKKSFSGLRDTCMTHPPFFTNSNTPQNRGGNCQETCQRRRAMVGNSTPCPYPRFVRVSSGRGGFRPLRDTTCLLLKCVTQLLIAIPVFILILPNAPAELLAEFHQESKVLYHSFTIQKNASKNIVSARRNRG